MARIAIRVFGPDGQSLGPHAGQKAILQSDARIKVVCWGRQAGKTTAAAIYAVKKGLEKKSRIWIVAPTYTLTSELWNRMRSLLENIHESMRILKKAGERKIELTNGTIYEKRSAHKPNALRGGTLDVLIIDEAAFVTDEAWHTVRPATVVRKAEILLISSPFGKNWFYEEWLRGQGPEKEPDYESWQFPSTINPYFTEEDLETARRSTPESTFRREYLAEFVDSGLEVFPVDLIKQCTSGKLHPRPDGAKTYIAGIDLAKYQDWTVIVVMDNEGHVVDFDRFQQLDWRIQKERIIRMLKKWNAIGYMDSTGVGDPIFDDLRGKVRVKPYRFTYESKKALVENLLVAMEQGLVSFPHIDTLIHELSIFQRSATKDGRIHYSHPAGQHDDCVIALALATWGLVHTTPLEALMSKRRIFT